MTRGLYGLRGIFDHLDYLFRDRFGKRATDVDVELTGAGTNVIRHFGRDQLSDEYVKGGPQTLDTVVLTMRKEMGLE